MTSELPGNKRRRRKRTSPPKKIDELSGRLLENLKNIQASPTLILSSRWKEIIGAELDGHIQLGKLDSEGILHLVAENSNWATKARWQTAEIQNRAVQFLDFGQIKGVKITVARRQP